MICERCGNRVDCLVNRGEDMSRPVLVCLECAKKIDARPKYYTATGVPRERETWRELDYE
jgi:hypothetical protein